MVTSAEKSERLNSLNYVVLSVVVIYTIFAQKFVIAKPILGAYFDPAFVLLTSVGFYNLLLKFMFFLFTNVPFLLQIYWGKIFVHGYWSYTYTVDGPTDAEDKIFFGVWRFEQSLYDTKVVGYGLHEDFRVRSRVRSVSDLIRNGEMYEIINIRSDSIESAVDNYSRTSMFFEMNRRSLFKFPEIIRGKTVVYGGVYSGRVYNTVFRRHNNAKTEQDVIDILKSQHAPQLIARRKVGIPSRTRKSRGATEDA